MNDKVARGNASQFFVAGELCRRNLIAVVTMGNTPHADILCSNVEGTRFAYIQVKTFVPGNSTVSVGQKAERDYGKNFFWVLAGIPKPDQSHPFGYFIIPCSEVARNVAADHRNWLSAPSAKGDARQDSTVRIIHLPPKTSPLGWDIAQYRNRWDLITDALLSPSSDGT
jgi:hypothetical protein